MASLFVLSIILMASISLTEASRQFKVGDDSGWREPDPLNPSFYSQWAQTNRFHIGDSLEFVYKNDSVITVEKLGYDQCDARDPIAHSDDGKSVINLDRSGLFYFISGNHDHCINGQKMIVDVMSPHPIIPPSSSPPSDISPQSQVGPSPSAHGKSSSVILKSDFMANLIVFVVMLLHYYY